MKRKITILILFLSLTLIISNCQKDRNNPLDPKADNYIEPIPPVTSPFLICANRNPGGVGFDFVMDGEKGAAYNLDEVPDLEWDVYIKVYKGVTNDGGNLFGKPFIKLYSTTVLAKVVSTNGQAGYNAITSTAGSTSGLAADGIAVMNITEVKRDSNNNLWYKKTPPGGGHGLKYFYDKIIIGEKWKKSAKAKKNQKTYIIKTREARHAKFMVKEFPASGAPTPTGYVDIIWDLLD